MNTVTVTIAPNGNAQITSTAPGFPSIALPAKHADSAQSMARTYLVMAECLTEDAPELVWKRVGHTVLADGSQRPAFRAQF